MTKYPAYDILHTMKKTGLYIITNRINNKAYIGQSTDLKRRITAHKRASTNQVIHTAIKKHGWKNFDVEVFDNIPECDLDRFEMFLIERLDTFHGKGYNCSVGGASGSNGATWFDKDCIRGYRSGRLTAFGDAWIEGKESKTKALCDCGYEVEVYVQNLKKDNHTTSCGCLHREVSKKYNRERQTIKAGMVNLAGTKVLSIYYTKLKTKKRGKEAMATVLCKCGLMYDVRCIYFKRTPTATCIGCGAKRTQKSRMKKVILTHPDGTETVEISAAEAERKYNLPKRKVSAVCNGQRKHTKGYKARYYV